MSAIITQAKETSYISITNQKKYQMKKILILGAGMAGTVMANKLFRNLNKALWEITIVDKDENHYYQPGFLFIPFGIYNPEDIIKPKREFIPAGVEFILSEVQKVTPESKKVLLKNGAVLTYDILVVGTCTIPVPEET